MTIHEPEIFRRGQDASRPVFSGSVWLAGLLNEDQTAAVDTSVYNVTFAPGSRNNWHRHSHGQILLATRGVGYHQIRGQAVDILRPGDVVVCPPNTDHWHGGGPDGEFTHVGISPRAAENELTWLEPVSDQEYEAADRPQL